MSIALEIKAEAVRQSITMKDLATAMDTYPERLSRAFSGERELKTSELEKASQFLGLPMWELVRRAEGEVPA